MLFFGMEANMNATFSFLISVGIIAFGIWIVAGTIAAGSPLAWALMGLLTTIATFSFGAIISPIIALAFSGSCSATK